MGGGGRGAGTAPCACQLRYVSVPGHILSSAQYACARGPRGDVMGEGRLALGGLGGAGKTDASSKRRGFRHPKLHVQHGPRRPRAPRAVVARGHIKAQTTSDCPKVRAVQAYSVSRAGTVGTAPRYSQHTSIAQPVNG